MSLFNDLDFVTAADMASLDSEILAVGRTENITIDGPGGIAAHACDEVGQKLLNETQAFAGFMPPYAMPYNQTAAVLNLVGPSVNRSRIALSQVVVTHESPTEFSVARPSTLKRYAIYLALEMFYRQAYYRKIGDRYEKRMFMYGEEIRKKYWPRFYNRGVPIAYKHLACPGAIHEYNAGLWDKSRIAAVAGTNALAVASYDVAVTWVDNSKYISPLVKANAESGPSAKMGIDLATNLVLQVDISTLNAPNGLNPLNVSLGQGVVVPGNATGWNVYVGQQGGVLYLQNNAPVPIATKTYTLLATPTLSGYTLDSGQYSDAHLTMQRVLMRG